MREILFRAKHINPYGTEDWYYGCYERSDNVYHYIIEENGSIIPINPKTLGQFTGLYDKNDMRMFEGDIVKARMTDKYTVVFNRGSFMGEYTSPYGRYTVRVDLLKDDWEVIGNIYDNPELLEEKSYGQTE